MFLFLLFLQAHQLRFNITTPEGNLSEFITLETYQTLILKFDMTQYQIGTAKIIIYITDKLTYSVNKTCTVRIMNRQASSLSLSINATDTKDSTILDAINIAASIISPSRGILGQPALFPVVISSSLISSYMMPFNMPTNQIYNVDVINGNLATTPESQTPFGTEFWQEYQTSDITLLAIEWIPFMGNCKDQGDYLYLYNILENSTFCNLVSQSDTKGVSMIPTSGFNANGDSCHATLECYYLENLQLEYEGNKWWQSEGDTLFYISKYALNYQFLVQNSDDSLSNYFLNIIQAQEETLIPVSFTTAGSLTNRYPSKFIFNIKYNQISTTEKQIVSASITASDYQTISQAINSYTFDINLEAMNYMELINSFQYDITLYLVLYIIIGILINIAILFIWIINKSISIIPDPPKLRMYQTFIVAFLPPITGCVRATVPIVLYVLILKYLLASSLFSGISFNYDAQSDEQITADTMGRMGLMLVVSGIVIMKIACKLCNPKPNDEDWGLIRANHEKNSQEKYFDFSVNEDESKETPIKQDEIREQPTSKNNVENNMQSNSISRQGSIMSKQVQGVPGSAPPIVRDKDPLPKKSLFKKATILKQNSSIKDNQSLKDSISPMQLLPRQQYVQIFRNSVMDKKPSVFTPQQAPHPEPQEEEEEDIVDQLKDSLASKDYHYQFISILTTVMLLFFLGFSYEQIFYQNLYYFLIVLQFIDAFFFWLLSKYLLEEQTLIEPLMACLEVTQFVMFMAAESFQQFVISFVIRLCLIIVFRTYINPVIRNFKHFGKKLMIWINSWHPMFNIEYESEKVVDDNISFYLGQHTDAKFTEEQSIEYVIQMTLSFSSKVHAIFIKPIMFVFIKIFEKESQIPNNYYIGFREFDYYIYFAFFVIIPQIFIDIYVLNSLEMIYGFKLFDYFDYCHYRNEFKYQKFFEHSLSYDKSLDTQYRSTDNMKFTDQFYYNGSLMIYSILLLIIGTTIIIRNNYVLYQDPAIFIIILFLYIFITLVQHMMLYVWYKMDVWKIKDTKQKMNLDSLEEFLNPAKENIEQIIEVDTIKKHFITLNKDWLIGNLELFINADSFNQQDEYLLQTYQMLVNDERKAQKEILRNEQMIKKQKELELKSKKKKRRSQQSNVKSQRDIEEIYGQQQTIRLKRSQVENLRKILSIWYYKAKQILFLKYLVSDVVAQNQAEHCKRCGLDIELRVVELIPFEKMSNQFKYRIMGTPFNKFEWIKYYENHQKFVTLCIDCESAYRSRLLQRQNQTTNDVAKLTQQNFVAKAFVYKWLYTARSNMLHNLLQQQ